ncbi:MAG: DUF1501 domain-containing protein [Pirellulales bacterium]|nr:DUF1501 domain-containing protein [Pirellulales bacterium]
MTTPFSRRRFLQTSVGTSSLVALGLDVPGFLARTAQAASLRRNGNRSKPDNVLVVIQLSGGNDGLNTVIPYADPLYAKNRILLRIPEQQIIKIDDHIGFHPSLSSFGELLEQDQLAVVQGVGYPNPDRSHFRSMDIWHSAAPKDLSPRTGWLGRALDSKAAKTTRDAAALHLGANELPLALVARETAVPSIDSLDAFRLRTSGGALTTDTLRELSQLPTQRESALAQFIQRSTLSAIDSSQRVQESLSEKSGPTTYPGYGLARKLQLVAQLIDAGMETGIYYVELAGFDTHSSQVDTHAALLRELGDSTTAFLKDLQARGQQDRVLVMSFSEFGRRVRENSSAGTDHGTAAPMFLAGAPVQSGAIGAHPSLIDLQAGDLKFHTDFRSVYAGVLDGWLGCDSSSILDGKFQPTPVLRV